MSNKILTKKIDKLSLEVEMLRSFFISVISEKDPEGEYRPEFVKKIFKIAKTKQPGIKFTTADALLRRISKS